ncbi:hypothetical protein HZQ08_10210 [Elizabethkingia anophelis]|nr:hypothetical protein [Elizabethkingia anophelis]MCT4211878.1 hypothetical protein [Elizabethkingia anophelis]
MPVKPFDGFIDAKESKILQDAISYLEKEDSFFKNNIFSLRRSISNKDFSSQSNSLYSILLEDFFELKERGKSYNKVTINGEKVPVREIINKVPIRRDAVNVVELKGYDPDYMGAIEDQIMKRGDYRSLDEYFEKIYNALKDIF